jgi:hypothetical protein
MIRTIMRNLLSLLALVLLALTITGWFRGWYSVESLPTEPGRSAYRVEIDRSRMGDDISSAGKAIVHMFSGEKNEDTTEPARGK